MNCPREQCGGLLLEADGEPVGTWRCVACARRYWEQPASLEDELLPARKGSMAFRAHVAEGMRRSWQERRGPGRPRKDESAP